MDFLVSFESITPISKPLFPPLIGFVFDSLCLICTGFITLEFKYSTPKNAYAVHNLFQWIWITAACILSNNYEKELSSFLISCSLSCFPARSKIQFRAVQYTVLQVLE